MSPVSSRTTPSSPATSSDTESLVCPGVATTVNGRPRPPPADHRRPARPIRPGAPDPPPVRRTRPARPARPRPRNDRDAGGSAAPSEIPSRAGRRIASRCSGSAGPGSTTHHRRADRGSPRSQVLVPSRVIGRGWAPGPAAGRRARGQDQRPRRGIDEPPAVVPYAAARAAPDRPPGRRPPAGPRRASRSSASSSRIDSVGGIRAIWPARSAASAAAGVDHSARSVSPDRSSACWPGGSSATKK